MGLLSIRVTNASKCPWSHAHASRVYVIHTLRCHFITTTKLSKSISANWLPELAKHEVYQSASRLSTAKSPGPRNSFSDYPPPRVGRDAAHKPRADYPNRTYIRIITAGGDPATHPSLLISLVPTGDVMHYNVSGCAAERRANGMPQKTCPPRPSPPVTASSRRSPRRRCGCPGNGEPWGRSSN